MCLTAKGESVGIRWVFYLLTCFNIFSSVLSHVKRGMYTRNDAIRLESRIVILIKENMKVTMFTS